MGTRVLYISYDGLMEPLGQSQVLQYLRRLASCHGHDITLLSFEKASDFGDLEARRAVRDQAADSGFRWVPLRYHKRPSGPATAFDVACGLAVAATLVWRRGIRIVHARSYVAALIAVALQRLFGTRFVFDMRGFWADERVEGGMWRAGSALYRVAKACERRFLARADVVVSLTHAAVVAMRAFPYLAARPPRFEVIPTCVNLDLFSPAAGGDRVPGEPFVLGYLGSVGSWYLFDRVIECFRLVRELRPGARLRIVNRGQHALVRELLRDGGLEDASVDLVGVSHPQVPAQIRRMDAGIFFCRPMFSKLATAPTRLGEFLASGIPCLTNVGVGDLETIVEPNRVGVTLRDFSRAAEAEGVARLLELVEDPHVAQRCVQAARRHFSLELGASAYDSIYRSLSP